jgi:hypothetical protein
VSFLTSPTTGPSFLKLSITGPAKYRAACPENQNGEARLLEEDMYTEGCIDGSIPEGETRAVLERYPPPVYRYDSIEQDGKKRNKFSKLPLPPAVEVKRDNAVAELYPLKEVPQMDEGIMNTILGNLSWEVRLKYAMTTGIEELTRQEALERLATEVDAVVFPGKADQLRIVLACKYGVTAASLAAAGFGSVHTWTTSSVYGSALTCSRTDRSIGERCFPKCFRMSSFQCFRMSSFQFQSQFFAEPLSRKVTTGVTFCDRILNTLKLACKPKSSGTEHCITSDNKTLRLTVYDSGTLETRVWYKNGQLHREDGPAREEFYNVPGDESRRIDERRWYNNGQLHREDGPAREEFYNIDGDESRRTAPHFLNPNMPLAYI